MHDFNLPSLAPHPPTIFAPLHLPFFVPLVSQGIAKVGRVLKMAGRKVGRRTCSVWASVEALGAVRAGKVKEVNWEQEVGRLGSSAGL